MNLNSLNNKKIGILGLGLENQALIKYLLKYKVECEIIVCDDRSQERLGEKFKKLKKTEMNGHSRLRINWQDGEDFDKGLEKFDILFRSPGWPINCPGIKKALGSGAELFSAMKLFFAFSPSKNIIGVTGTKGKGTTASLIYEILKQAGKRAWLGGNIGVAPFEFIDKIKKNDWIVLELSSLQLEDMTVSPLIAIITNLSPEHLAPADPINPNYHKSLKDYYNAKLNIIKYQKPGDRAILNQKLGNKNLPIAKVLASRRELGAGEKTFFTKSKLLSKLIGEHNKENIGAAVAVAKIIGVKDEAIKRTVAKFKGLPHRLELVRELDGAKYYDDSFATTPESTIIALKSFSVPIILFLGGADKGSDFTELAREIKKPVQPVKSSKTGNKQFNRVKLVVLLAGQATSRIKEMLVKAGYENNKMKLFDNIRQAVKLAKTKARSGDVVLLSTACASFGMFKNYKERGNLFKKEVLKNQPT